MAQNASIITKNDCQGIIIVISEGNVVKKTMQYPNDMLIL